MKKFKHIVYAAIVLLFIVACNSRKSGSDFSQSDIMDVMVSDSLRIDTLHHPSHDESDDDYMPSPPPDGRRFDGPPPHGKDHHKPDNMRGFDPASEDDMDDNGMSRYMENNDDEGWD